MALKVGELESDISLDDSKFDKGLDDAHGKFGRFAKKLTQDAEKSGGDAGSGLGDAMGQGLGKVAGALALADLGAKLADGIKEGFGKAMDFEAANDKLAAQMDLSASESARLGKVAGQLYAANYGESVGDVNTALKGVITNIDGMRGASNEAVQDATKKVIDLGTAFDQDVGESSRAAGKLMKTGLAKDATESLDLMTKGFQSGADEAGDLLDTINEYSTQFREAGLSGGQFMGLLSQGLQAGARDADTVADAIKEFEIRGRDGSVTTVAGFKAIGLNAKQMASDIAAGGPKSAAALDLTLDRLRNMHDPVKRDAAAVQLFGTKAEDLGDALFALDPSSAVAALGNVKGAAQSMDDTLGGNAKNTIESFKRTVEMAFVNKVGPIIEKFTAWLSGPGKYEVLGFFIDAGSAVTGLVSVVGPALKFIDDMFLNWVGGMIAGAAKAFGWVPGIGEKLKKANESFQQFKEVHDKALDTAIKKSGEWNASLAKMKTDVLLKANISDWEQKLKAAKKQLEDKSLTKERRAQLVATVTDLQNKINTAKGALGSKELTATKVAQLQANKTDLDTKIRAAKTALGSKELTATKRAQLEANITQLLQKKRDAQNAINALTGKTVYVSVRAKVDSQLARSGYVEGRAVGGPVTKGTPYVVGEHRPELFVPDENGIIVPRVPGPTHVAAYGANFGPAAAVAGPTVIELRSSGSAIDNWLMEMLRRAIRVQGGNVQVVLGTGRIV